MSIEIISIRTVKHGIKGRIIKKICGVEAKSDLPEKYLSAPLHCYMGERDDNENVLYISEGTNLVAHSSVFYTEKSFQYIMKNIGICASCLKQITNDLKMDWYGEEKEII